METKFKETEIGRIPEEWTIKPLSKLVGSDKLDFIDGDWIESPYITSEGIRLIQTGNIDIGSFLDTTRRYVSEQTFVELKCKEVYSGDMLICRLAAPIGRACIVPDTGEKYITAVDCTIVRPDSTIADKYYLNHFINWRRTLNLMERYGGGVTHQRISRKNLGKIPIPLPPLPEQRKIAAILSTVDETIEKTDAIIEETQQLKKGLMQKLFNEGIRCSRFKETKNGQIPEEWEVVKIKEVCRKKTNKFEPRESKITYPYVGLEHIEAHLHKLNGYGQSDETLSTKNMFATNDILYGKLRPYLNKVWKAEFNGVCTTEIIVILANDNIEQDYLYYSLQQKRFVGYVNSMTEGTSLPRANWDDIQKYQIALPPKEEQFRIIEILTEVDTKIKTEQAYKAEMEQLKKGLMQVLLTGKVRVKV